MAISSTKVVSIPAPINIKYLKFSMLSTILLFHSALQEIPTSLRLSE